MGKYSFTNGIITNRIIDSLPETVHITDVGPRDGLQNETKILSPQIKIQLINMLKNAGLKNIECGSFVNPKLVPTMANTDQVFDILNKDNESGDDDTTYIGLVLNKKGMERAIDKNVKQVLYVLSASQEFSKRNMNCSTDEVYDRMRDIVKLATSNNITFRVVISTALGCPYQGNIDPLKVCDIINKISKDYTLNEIENIIIADTIGIASAGSINELLNEIIVKNDSFGFKNKLGIHFHDTYGQALTNILISLSYGINIIESSVGGLGGCPFAKGATGNVATEDIVYMLNGLGIKTNIDLDKLIDASNFITEQLGKDKNASSVARAINAKRENDKHG